MNAERVRRAIGLVLFVAFGLGVAIYLLARVGTTVLPQGKQYTFEADVKSSVALANAADVREAGVEIGRVSGIKQAGAITALQIKIKAKYGPVYKNATVLIRAKSVAGENYVQLDPGDPKSGALASGGVLPVSQDLQPVQDDDVFSILGPPQQKGLQTAVSGLGSGLTGDGGNNLNQTVGAMTSVVNQGQDFARILADEKTQTAQLISSFDTVAGALGSRASDIRVLTDSSLATARAVATRDAALRATLGTLPAFLRQSRTTAGKLGAFSSDAAPVIGNLRIAAQDLVPAVQSLTPAAREATQTLAALERFAKVALPTFRQLTPFANDAKAFVKPYSGFLQQANPLVAYLNPYWRELSTWFANTGAAVNASDSISKLARVTLPISRSDFPTIVQGQLAQLVAKLSNGQDTRGSNPYPAPGTSATLQPQQGTVPPVTADPPYTKRATTKQPAKRG